VHTKNLNTKELFFFCFSAIIQESKISVEEPR